MTKKPIIPDTSVIIDGRLSKMLKAKKLEGIEIVISQIVLDELEAQANRGLDIGFSGLKEIQALRGFESAKLSIEGVRPSSEEIKLAKKGRLDAMIRDLAKKKDGTLYTQDMVQAEVAKAEGIDVVYIKSKENVKIPLEKYFTKDTMSVHLKEGAIPLAKKGTPGNLKLVEIDKKRLTREQVEELSEDIIELTRHRDDARVEISKYGGQVLQVSNYRIAIAKPPFSSGMEITAVRPIVKFTIDDYNLDKKLMDRLETKADGLLITGPPGSGKTTFAQSLAEFYWKKGKIIKTMESPRDLSVPPEITQYGPLEGSMTNTADILLLVRPDYTIYDEIRTTKDFGIFSDMRLAGVGMVGVIHSAAPVDAIHRFMGRTELGMIPHVIDTIIYIRGGKIEKVYSISLCVRVPSGMTDADLARPVVEIRDFYTNRLEYEIYTYGEENVVIPVEVEGERGLDKLAKERLYEEFAIFDRNCEIELVGKDKVVIKVRNDAIGKIIGREGRTIDEIEKRLGIRIDVQPKVQTFGKEADFEIGESGAYVSFLFGKEMRGRNISVYLGSEYVFSATAGKEGQIKLAKDSDLGKRILSAISTKKDLKAFVTS